jgi:hypothetical protein
MFVEEGFCKVNKLDVITEWVQNITYMAL